MALRVVVATVGKPATHILASIEHYAALLKPYCALLLRSTRPHTRAAGEPVARVCQREAAALRGLCEPRGYLVGLSAEGQSYDSGHFARWLAVRIGEARPLCFVVGGAYGLAPAFKGECRELLSLSRMTMAHDVALAVLCEQLFRAYSILRGHPYHK